MESQSGSDHTLPLGAYERPDTPENPTQEFTVVPGGKERAGGDESVAWRVRFTPANAPTRQFGLEIGEEIVLGRLADGEKDANLVDLNPYGGKLLGVSRRHVRLRPTATNLFMVDLGSTNGTFRNGRSIGSRTPYSLVDRDVVTLGRLSLLVEIVDRPSLPAGQSDDELDVTEAMLQIAKAITSQLDLDDVLHQVADTAQSLTSAGETGIWLVDEDTGELLLEAQWGIGNERTKRMRLPTGRKSLAGEVLRTGKTVRASREPGQEEIKVKTGYLVESLVFVPVTQGGISLGVLSAAHREPGMKFSRRDERLLEAIADFAAIAIQNARLYRRTDEALAHRVQELSALNQLSFTLSSSLNLDKVYQVLKEQIRRYWPVEAINLHLLEEDHLRHHVSQGLKPDPARHRLNQGIVGRVARTGEVVVSNEPSSNQDFDPAADAPGIEQPRSLLCVPLRVKGRIVGVLSLLNKQGGDFTNEDVARLQAFTSPVAAAVENARLYTESERRRRAIQATAKTLPQPLLIVDDGGRPLVANDAAQKLMDTNMSDLSEAVSSGVGKTMEVQIGTETYLSTTERVAGVGTIVVMQDISYVKKLENDRTDFMHALSHDMRNPLTSIIGYTQVMDRTLPPDEGHRQYLRNIRISAGRMLEMVSQLLRTVDGDLRQQISVEACRLEPILARVIDELEGITLNKSINVEVSTEGAPADVMADADRLYHALLNLVENAVKYSPRETTVHIRLSFSPEEAIITVADEGPGIAEEDLPHVFEKYYRGSKGSKEPGTGLGLAVAQSIVEAHGGEIRADNWDAGGAVFTFHLPAGGRAGEADEAGPS